MGVSKVEHGLCKVEYLALKERIQERLEAGYPISYIHRELSGEGAITMSYRSLHRLVNADKAGKWSGLATDTVQSANRPVTTPLKKKPIVSKERGTSIKRFVFDKKMNFDDLWKKA